MPGTGWRRITFTDRDDLQKILEVRYSMLVNVVRPLFVPLPACTHPLLIPLPRMHFNVPMSSVFVHLFAERMSNETKTKKKQSSDALHSGLLRNWSSASSMLTASYKLTE